MVWKSLRALQSSTRIEFVAALAARHAFVQLPSGKWCRVLGMPGKNCVHVRGRIYRMVASGDTLGG
jgi:predicted transcriptional regulator